MRTAPRLRGDDGIGHAQRQIVMGMHAALGFRAQHPVIGFQPGAVAVHVQRAAAVGDIDAM